MQIINSTTQIIDLPELLRRDEKDAAALMAKVAAVLQDVRLRGDAAVCDFTRAFDSIDTGTPRIMSRVELEEYCKQTARPALTDDQIEAIELAVANISWFASQSMPSSWSAIAPDGQIVGEVFRPFDRVACYVPQGSFPLVSTAIHTAALARVAGVSEIVMVTSPSDRPLNPAVVYAAMLSGITEIIFAGGAQGIAAVAYGTETINRVDFICGPGNQYVAEAKRQLFGTVGIDMVAGPSECFVIADDTAEPYAVACDLIAQAEHGSGLEAAVLLTDSQELIDSVAQVLETIKDRIVGNPGFLQVWDNTLLLVLTDNIETAVKLTNNCAPEHVEVQTLDSGLDAQGLINAGAVFIGSYSAEPLGDFVAGPSHVLPTNGTARFTSGLSVSHFMNRKSTISITAESYPVLAQASKEFADMEGLVGHGMSSVARVENNNFAGSDPAKGNEK
ncbi:MAG TPA: histidinol dehydrogenase [Acidimicrobiia bacterium]|nr:histidinol dehydrogenase [Acidimicrobiia bacterium]